VKRRGKGSRKLKKNISPGNGSFGKRWEPRETPEGGGLGGGGTVVGEEGGMKDLGGERKGG